MVFNNNNNPFRALFHILNLNKGDTNNTLHPLLPGMLRCISWGAHDRVDIPVTPTYGMYLCDVDDHGDSMDIISVDYFLAQNDTEPVT